MDEKLSGILYIIATPIGNLGDITLRALEMLRKVDLIAAEDTRHSRKLLSHYGINCKIISLHEHNETERCQLLLNELHAGRNIALISDAGTPLISDPGYVLVKEVRAQNINVVPLPGPSALIAALSVAGLPTAKFIFEGFLPAKIGAVRQRLIALQDETRTIVFYESPHRLLQLLTTMREVFGCTRHVVLAKELTKIHETIYGANLDNVLEWLQLEPVHQKGEFVILVAGAELQPQKMLGSKEQEILEFLLKEVPVKLAVKIAAKVTGANKNKLYDLALSLGDAKWKNDISCI